MSKKRADFIKYFHELTEDEFKVILKENRGRTYAWLARRYPQPTWCNYPDAAMGIMGCWSLISFMVKNKEYCVGCDCCRARKISAKEEE